MTDFKSFCKNFADEIDGQYQEYDETQSVVVVPLKDGRFQAVTGHLSRHVNNESDVVTVKSKVCNLNTDIPYEEMLKENLEYPYGRFVIEGEFLKVEASAFLEHITEGQIKEMMLEVAQLADIWENRITGKDIH
jgi:hypothetical protein